MGKTKVLIIISKLCIGGAERVARDIGYFADKRKYDIDYIVFGDKIGEYEADLEKEGCTIYHFASPYEGYYKFYTRLKKLIKDNKYDVVHAHTLFNSGWAMMAAKACKVPVRISHSHTIKGPEQKSKVRGMYEKYMQKKVLKHSTHYVACGQGAGEWLYGKDFFDKNGTIVYNGIDLYEFAYDEEKRNAIREKVGLQDKFVIGHVGHLAPVKNQGYIIGLMPEILKKKPNAVFVCLGEGEDREKLEKQIAELNLTDNVKLVGNTPLVGEYMSAMDVYVFPSHYEGMPLALVEAQTNGLPCLISDKIPSDALLTDLIKRIPIEGKDEEWVNEICSANRVNPESYCEKLKELGFDTTGMVNNVYKLYEEANK